MVVGASGKRFSFHDGDPLVASHEEFFFCYGEGGISAGIHFFGAKDFFEKNESKIMRTELANSLSGLADDYLKHEQARVETLYQEILRQNFARLLQDLTEESNDFYYGLLETLDGGVAPEELLMITNKVEQIIG